uniref:Flavodoxin-like fold domain-containing protein n=1 Tax=Callorhinchus milii TaxID=7868 RepID=A0A4W3K8A8_CALMI
MFTFVSICSGLYKVTRMCTVQINTGDVHDPSHFNYGVEISEAYKKGILSKDVVEKQKKLKEADFVIFQFSLYWSNVPAILNGWIGQVFVEGMAYGISKCYNLGYFNRTRLLIDWRIAFLGSTTVCGHCCAQLAFHFTVYSVKHFDTSQRCDKALYQMQELLL